jgi:hypothetical protein
MITELKRIISIAERECKGDYGLQKCTDDQKPLCNVCVSRDLVEKVYNISSACMLKIKNKKEGGTV